MPSGDEMEMGERLLRLTAEPDRFRALVLLNDRTATTSEVAKKLNVSLDTASRHLAKLREEGLIEAIDEASPDAGPDLRYQALVRTLWSDEEWAALSFEERKRLTAWTVEWIYDELREAVEAGTFSARSDSHCSRSVALMDEQGWRELARIQADALEAVFAAQAASAERLAERGEAGIPVLSTMVCCELPAGDERPD